MFYRIFMADLVLFTSGWWVAHIKRDLLDSYLPPCFTDHLLVAMALYQKRICYAV